MKGAFKPHQPLHNYPLITVSGQEKIIYGVYQNTVVDLAPLTKIDLVNGTLNTSITIRNTSSVGYKQTVWNCKGEKILEQDVTGETVQDLAVPPAGIIELNAL